MYYALIANGEDVEEAEAAVFRGKEWEKFEEIFLCVILLDNILEEFIGG